MKKRINSEALMQEFEEGSVFFRKPPANTPPPPKPPSSPIQSEPVPSPLPVLEPPVAEQSKSASERDTVIPRHHDTTVDTTVSRYRDTTPLFEKTRRAVKHLGKEAATHRFTVEEKRILKKIEHEYALKEIRTSENEITRIAINYLCEEYRLNKENSVLAKILDLLNS
jgi:hypothetical protein